MKSKLIKIGILLPVCFFGILWGCVEITVNENLWGIEKVSIENWSDANMCNNYSTKLTVHTKYLRTEKITGIIKSSSNTLWANTNVIEFPAELSKEQKIVKYSLKTIPSDIELTNNFQNMLKENVSDFVEKMNTGFFNNTELSAIVDEVFYLKTPPQSLRNKNFRIVFSIETKEGKVFADTTKIIHLD